MKNVNQQEIKTLKDRQAEIYEAEEKINKELVDLENWNITKNVIMNSSIAKKFPIIHAP